MRQSAFYLLAAVMYELKLCYSRLENVYKSKITSRLEDSERADIGKPLAFTIKNKGA